MPIYEYQCLACGRRSSVFVRSASSKTKPACEHCGSVRLSRLMSKFAVHGGRINLDDPSSLDIDESDPRAMARFMRQMGEESGEPMEPEMEEMIGRMEAGESPDAAMTGSALEDSVDDGGLGEDF
jgi:putative FmdB family regulatory protein